MILPPMDKLMANLTAAGGISWTDAEGLHVRRLSPFPGSEILASNPVNFALAEAMAVGMAYTTQRAPMRIQQPASD